MVTADKSTVLVVGGNGFVGRAVVSELVTRGQHRVRVAARRPEVFPGVEAVCCGLDLAAATDWSPALSGVDSLIVCAARVHQMKDRAADPLEAFRAVNTVGTLALARQAAAAGVRRLVFLSTIKVNGEQSGGHSLRADDVPHPDSPYAQSKYEAEQSLLDIARDTGMAVVIIRPPLVYGPGAPGNFARLLHWVRRGVPLPLGAVDNRRSLVFLGNLVDMILRCLDHPAAAQRVFLVSDNEDLSTTDLLRRTGAALGRSPSLIPVPVPILKGILCCLGRRDLSSRLLGSLQVDIRQTMDDLDWVPPFDVDTALSLTVQSH